MQLFSHGQWWSKSATHRSHNRQCLARRGCDCAHAWHTPGRPAVERPERIELVCLGSCGRYPGSASAVAVPKAAVMSRSTAKQTDGNEHVVYGSAHSQKAQCEDSSRTQRSSGRPRRRRLLDAVRFACSSARDRYSARCGAPDAIANIAAVCCSLSTSRGSMAAYRIISFAASSCAATGMRCGDACVLSSGVPPREGRGPSGGW
mmetsp:Transcript_42462/g.99451  ORF Transcript_42462/g.99451 Transcript_42462/m.99451 type:complete len:204 (-) Transcript_42462:75-686(-)